MKFLNRLRKDRQGIILTIAVATLVMVMGTILWLIALIPIITFNNLLPSLGLSLPPQEHSISNMNLVVAGLVEVCIIVGPLAWIFIAASRRGPEPNFNGGTPL